MAIVLFLFRMYACPAVNTGDIMSAQAYSEAWKSYMHDLNICAGGRDKVRHIEKEVANMRMYQWSTTFL